jgi:type IV pilus assembly protein PilA
MLYKLRRVAAEEKGFTLIELLVVILIIGILAAIAIPTFLNQKTKANDASAESMARTAATAMEAYATSNNGSYSGATVSSLKAIEPTINDVSSVSNAYVVSAGGDATGYTIVADAPSGDRFTLTDNSATNTFTCAPPGKGSCSPSGTW